MSGIAALASDASVLAARLRGVPLVILLDLDGTLAPIVPHPDQAVVPERTRGVLDALVRANGVHVGVVSGRGAADARARAGVPGIWAIGNHGLETIAPDGTLTVDDLGLPYVAAIAEAASALPAELVRWPGAYVEDKGLTLSVHYRAVVTGSPADLARAVTRVASRAGLRVTNGNTVLEIRPPVAVDKGTAVLMLAERLGAGAVGASIVFAGDDATDEDAVRALRGWRSGAVTIHVRGTGGWSSAAELEVESPAALAVWLESLAGLRGAALPAAGPA
jgi:trehalose-phosphatase